MSRVRVMEGDTRTGISPDGIRAMILSAGRLPAGCKAYKVERQIGGHAYYVEADTLDAAMALVPGALTGQAMERAP